MEQKTLKIQPNQDNYLEFLFDTPKQGTNSYGEWNMYGFRDENGEEVNLFATPLLHSIISKYTKGDIINIRKEGTPEGRTKWDVKATGQNLKELPASKSADSRSKDIHKQVALKLAVQSMETKENLDLHEVSKRMKGLLRVLYEELEPIVSKDESSEMGNSDIFSS